MTYQEVINQLYALQNKEKITFKAKKYGIKANNSLGIYHKDLQIIAKTINKNNRLAIELFNSNIYEGRLLCSKIFDPKDLTEPLMEAWVTTFENWEICDSFCMALFAKSKFALQKILEWTAREPEFEKRAGFAIMAAYCMADKKSGNDLFAQFFPIIIREAHDDRLYVKKAVNWALRNIGKRNKDLHQMALQTAQNLLKHESRSAQWIAKNAISELKKPNLRCSDYPRAIYRKS